MNRIKGLKIVSTTAMLLCGACESGVGPRVVSNPNPAAKIPAMREAAARKDMSVIPQLIRDLENDDAAIRFFAIDTLHRLTRQDFGYRYFAPEEQRAAAVKRWREFARSLQSPGSKAQ